MPATLFDQSTPEGGDLAECRELLRGGSRSFYAASLLLPKRVRRAATSLYAFCRLADDAVDGLDADAVTLSVLERRLHLAFEGRPLPIAADCAFADTVAEYAIPIALPAALLEGFSWDLSGRRYRDLASLEHYAARVAGSIGAMLSLVMGCREPWVVAGACRLGIAMQFTNIARDVGEDAAANRLYLPEDWLEEAGIKPGRWLLEPKFDKALGSVVSRLLQNADAYYRSADQAITALPPACQPGIRAARRLYAEIGHEVERAGFDSVTRRAVVSGQRKALIAVAAVLPGKTYARLNPSEYSTAAEFIIEAVADAPTRQKQSANHAKARIPWWDLDGQIGWVVDLFARLEHRAQRL